MRSEIKRITSALAMTSIFVTHDQEEAMSMSDRILVLNHGALEQAGSPIDIYTHPGHSLRSGVCRAIQLH